MTELKLKAAEPAEQDIEVPGNVVVRCPLVDFKLRQVGEHCPSCKHWRGVLDNFPGGKMPFSKRYAVLCAAQPQRRELFEIEV